MRTGFVISVIVIFLGTLFFLLTKRVKKSVLLPVAGLPEIDNLPNLQNNNNNNKWWKKLSSFNQLGLAVFVTELAMPVWNNYALSGIASYTDPSLKIIKYIDINLLPGSLKEVKLIIDHLPDINNYKKINELYNQFVGPVVALQDGDWIPPYAVKKIFLACYHILKSVAENNNINSNDGFFAIAIDNALDSIDMAKLYDAEQIDNLLKNYGLPL